MFRNIKRIWTLYRLASDQKGTPEGNTALKQAKVLEGKIGIEIPEDSFEESSHEFETGYVWDRMTLEILAKILELNYSRIDRRVILRGPKLALEEAVETFTLHQDVVERLAVTSSIAYLCTAIPGFAEILLESKDEQSSKSNPPTKEDLPKAEKYDDFNVMVRAFSDIPNTEQGAYDLMRKIGSQNRRPFWKRFL